MNEKINIFMDWIYYKPYNSSNPIKRIMHRYKFWKFLRELKRVNPDFVMLWNIAYFIKLLKITFYYREKEFKINDIEYTNDNKAGFYLFENDYKIEFELSKFDRMIMIRVSDPSRGKSKEEISKISFIEGSLKIENIVDETQYDYLIGLILKRVSNVLKYYYNLR